MNSLIAAELVEFIVKLLTPSHPFFKISQIFQVIAGFGIGQIMVGRHGITKQNHANVIDVVFFNQLLQS